MSTLARDHTLDALAHPTDAEIAGVDAWWRATSIGVRGAGRGARSALAVLWAGVFALHSCTDDRPSGPMLDSRDVHPRLVNPQAAQDRSPGMVAFGPPPGTHIR